MEMTPEMYQQLMAQNGEGGQPDVPPEDGGQEPQGVAPALTPEQMAALQQQMMMQQQQAAAPQTPPAQEPPAEGDPVEEAKKMLGLDAQQQALQQMQEKLAEMEAQKAWAEIGSKYPDVPKDAVEQELEKLKQLDPTADKNPLAIEMAYKAAIASSKPQEKPDNLTQGAGGGIGGENLEDAVKSGKADDFTLGEYILGLKE